MTERPIIMTTSMVRGILFGRKTQTRRLARRRTCPYGAPGDRLWVRETWAHHKACNRAEHDHDTGCLLYKADHIENVWNDKTRWIHIWYEKKPSIHMPRWASRILLEIVSVRAERIQDISIEDIHAEGIDRWEDFEGGKHLSVYQAQGAFKNFWNSLYAKSGYGWDANPVVWRIEFRVLHDLCRAGLPLMK
ncbi:MAG: hypothetical protein GXP46_01755 [Deferribacteres bacterium]|nr:hypothetical protein [Deferribacteres bacterium]